LVEKVSSRINLINVHTIEEMFKLFLVQLNPWQTLR